MEDLLASRQSKMEQELKQYIFPPLASITEAYAQLWLDTDLIDYIIFNYAQYTIRDVEDEYGLTRNEIKDTVYSGVDLDYLVTNGYISSEDINKSIITDRVYRLSHDQKIVSDDVNNITILYTKTQDGVEMDQRVNVVPSNGSYFTVLDIVMGIGKIISLWKQYIGGVLPGADYFQYYGQSHPISIGEPQVILYQDGHLTLRFDIDGIYEY